MSSGPFSALTAYEGLHLAAHLSELRQFEALHRLLWLEDAEGRNAWYEFKQERNEAGSYLNDLSLGWAAAEAEGSLPMASRYALASASWVSLASSLHPRMFPALVRHGVWSRERALAAAMDTTVFRAEALGLLTQVLDDSTHELVFTTIAGDLKREGSARRMHLAAIGGFLPEAIVRDVLSWPPVAWAYDVPVHDTAAVLLPRLAELGHATEALQKARDLAESPEKYVALCGIAPFLPGAEGVALLDRLAGELKSSGHIEPDATLACALSRAYAALGEPARARQAALKDGWPGTRDLTLDHVVLSFARADNLEEARKCADLIEWPHKKARTLARLAPLMRAEDGADLLVAALGLARGAWQGHVEALRIEALAEVGARLDEPLRSQVLEEALNAALSSGDEFARASAVASIADLLTETLLARALRRLQVIGDDRETVIALAAHHHCAGQEACVTIEPECLRIIADMPQRSDRWISVRALLSKAHGPFRSAILSCASAVAAEMTEADWSRSSVLDLPSVAQEEWAAIMLDVTRRRPAARPQLLPTIAGSVRGAPWHDVLSMARELDDDDDRAGALEALLRHADSDGLEVIGALCGSIRNARASERLRAAVACRLAATGHADDALTCARQVEPSAEKLRSLTEIARFLGDPRVVLPDLIAALNSLRYRPIELNVKSLVEAAPAAIRCSFLEALRDWASRIGATDRERVFHELAGQMAAAGLLDEALACAQAIAQPRDRIGALAAICAEAPGDVGDAVAAEAWALAMTLPPGLTQASELSVLLPALRGELRERAVRWVDLHALAAEVPRTVADVVPLLLPQRTQDLLDVALDRPEVLSSFVRATIDAPAAEVRRHWQVVARSAGRVARNEALETLAAIAPWTHRLGGDQAVTGVAWSIAHVRRCWP